jgi:Icc-related predicted phosphoesterase
MESSAPEAARPSTAIRLAAVGDIHCRESRREEVTSAFASLAGDAHILLLAGDLTTYGEPQEAQVLVSAAGQLDIPIVAVLGNHDCHSGRESHIASHLPDFGEPLLRQVYARTTEDVEALDRSLREIEHCPARIVLLHYAPCSETLEGEPRDIWAFLGNDRLAVPILEHRPDLVIHGHAHAGTFEGRIGDVPVYNVSMPVLGRDFWRFELEPAPADAAPIH